MARLTSISRTHLFLIGYGFIGQPTISRVNEPNSSYVCMTPTAESDELCNIKPYTEDMQEKSEATGEWANGLWLSQLGPGRLVFIPDKMPSANHESIRYTDPTDAPSEE